MSNNNNNKHERNREKKVTLTTLISHSTCHNLQHLVAWLPITWLTDGKKCETKSRTDTQRKNSLSLSYTHTHTNLTISLINTKLCCGVVSAALARTHSFTHFSRETLQLTNKREKKKWKNPKLIHLHSKYILLKNGYGCVCVFFFGSHTKIESAFNFQCRFKIT